MKRKIYLAALFVTAFFTTTLAQQAVFPQGEKATTGMTGNVWMKVLSAPDSISNLHIANVAFEPGARTTWHRHPGGQVLLVTEGTGYYQERGKSVQIVRAGDVVRCLPDIEHWHGATPDSRFVHLGITTTSQLRVAIFLQPVTDEEYKRIK
jgi:quercetin dioxygenase-like cupin family protein